MTNFTKYDLSKNINCDVNESLMVLSATQDFKTHLNIQDKQQVTLVLLHEASQAIDMNLEINVGSNVNLTFALVSLVNQEYNANFTINLNGDDSVVDVESGLLGNANKKMYMTINHLNNRCVSTMNHYGLITTNEPFTIEASGVVKKYAKGNDCRQALRCATFTNNKAITLKPMLYIDDFDCQAAHACTIGQISPRQMYYLQFKGLSRKAIMALIAKGYMQPVVDCVNEASVKNYLQHLMDNLEANYVE